jgi:hypothetical protein
VEHPQADLSWKRCGFVLSFNECNLDCGTDLETLRDFTSISSDYYPDLASHCRQVMEEWYSVQGEGIQGAAAVLRDGIDYLGCGKCRSRNGPGTDRVELVERSVTT